MTRSPFAQGAALALAAAMLFGATAPFVKRFGVGVGPFATAAMLYAGATLGVLGRRSDREARVRVDDAPRLALVGLLGAAVAPAALSWGLQRAGGVAGSLVLNLEAVFTIALAWLFYREHVGARLALAAGLMICGGALLAVRGGTAASTAIGLGALTGATLAWALDNTVTRGLAARDPAGVVFWKALVGVTLSLAAASVRGEAFPSARPAVGLLACGALGYGLSLRLYLFAQRELGAGRTGSVFAVGPFIGAVIAVGLGDDAGAGWLAGAAALFGAAVWLHATERHAHGHRHDAVEHDHAHRHDDGHHEHVHDPPFAAEHSHRHRHGSVEHEHPHAVDLHHQHSH